MNAFRSFIINNLEQTFTSEDVGIAYIYCNYKDPEQTSANLLGSLLKQLLERRPAVIRNIRDIYITRCRKQIQLTITEYVGTLQKIVSEFSQVFIVIDALDELAEANGTRELFIKEIQKLLPKVHLLVTSRWVPSIQQQLETPLHVEIRASDKDITEYLKERMAVATRLQRHVKEDPQLQETIIRTIVKNCQGMYVCLVRHATSHRLTKGTSGFYLHNSISIL